MRVTLSPLFVQPRRMFRRVLLFVCGNFFALPLVLASIAQSPAPLAPGDLPEAEFQSLVEKTNLYVRALNAVAYSQRTYDRYASWVDLKKGPTGKERYISYGLYEIDKSTVDQVREAARKGPKLKPALPELDGVIVRMAEAFSALEPIVKKAHDYYEQEDYKDDGAQGGREMHASMMPLFEKTFAAERELRRDLDDLKSQVDLRQLAQIEKISGRKYEWHLRNYLLAAKSLISLLPENAEAPPLEIAAYKTRYAALEKAYNGFENFVAENPDDVKKVLLASLVETTVKDFFASSKFLRRTLEANKLDRHEYFNRVSEFARTYNELIQRTNSLP